jgi:hypothetical protein
LTENDDRCSRLLPIDSIVEVPVRSTRAAAAVARLNSRSEGHHYVMVLMSSGLLKLHERIASGDKQLSEGLLLDDFVRLVDSMGPQKIQRITKNEAAFAKQLVKKPKT